MIVHNRAEQVKEWPVLNGSSPIEKDFYEHVRQKLEDERKANQKLRSSMKEKGKALKLITERLQRQMDEATNKAGELEKELQLEREKNSKMVSYLSHLEKDVVESVSVIDSTKRELDETRNRYQKLRQEGDDRVDDISAENERMKGELGSIRSLVKKLRNQLEKEKAAHAGFRGESSRMLDAAREESAELNEQLRRSGDLLADLKTRFENKSVLLEEEHRIAAAKEREAEDLRETLSKTAAAAQKAQKDLSQRLSFLEEQNLKMAEDIEVKDEQLSQLKCEKQGWDVLAERIKMLESEKLEQSREIMRKEDLLEQAKGLCKAQMAEMEKQRNAAENNRETYLEKDRKLSELTNELSAAYERIQTMEQEVATWSSSYEDVNSALQAVTVESQQLQNGYDELLARNEELVNELSENVLRQRIEEMAEEYQALEVVLDDKRSELDAERTESKRQKHAFTILNADVEEQRALVESHKALAEELKSELVARSQEILALQEKSEADSAEYQQAVDTAGLLEAKINEQNSIACVMQEKINALQAALVQKSEEIEQQQAAFDVMRAEDTEKMSALESDLQWQWSVTSELKGKLDALRKELAARTDELTKQQEHCEAEREKRRQRDRDLLSMRRECRKVLDSVK